MNGAMIGRGIVLPSSPGREPAVAVCRRGHLAQIGGDPAHLTELGPLSQEIPGAAFPFPDPSVFARIPKRLRPLLR